MDTVQLLCKAIKADAAVQEMEKHRRYALFKYANQVKEQEAKEKYAPPPIQQQQVQQFYVAPTTSNIHHTATTNTYDQETMDMEDDGF